MFTRRNFLRALATGAAVGVVAPAALAELLAPKRTIFLPPRGGWAASLPQSFHFPGYVLTVHHIDPKALRILREHLCGYDTNEPFESNGGILV